jgi:hypothetical protein
MPLDSFIGFHPRIAALVAVQGLCYFESYRDEGKVHKEYVFYNYFVGFHT